MKSVEYADPEKRFMDKLVEFFTSMFKDPASLKQIKEAFEVDMTDLKQWLEERETEQRSSKPASAPGAIQMEFEEFQKKRQQQRQKQQQHQQQQQQQQQQLWNGFLRQQECESGKTGEMKDLVKGVAVAVLTPLAASAAAVGGHSRIISDLFTILQAKFILHFGAVIGGVACSALSLIMGTFLIGKSFYDSIEVMKQLDTSEAKMLVGFFKDYFDPYADTFAKVTENFLQHIQNYKNYSDRKEWNDEFEEKKAKVFYRFEVLQTSLERVNNTLEEYSKRVAKERSIWRCAFSWGFGFVQLAVGIIFSVFPATLPVGLLSAAAGSAWIVSACIDYHTLQKVEKVWEVAPLLKQHTANISKQSEMVRVAVENFERDGTDEPVKAITNALEGFNNEIILWRTALKNLGDELEKPVKFFDCVQS